jgi:hypothetical protein
MIAMTPMTGATPPVSTLQLPLSVFYNINGT